MACLREANRPSFHSATLVAIFSERRSRHRLASDFLTGDRFVFVDRFLTGDRFAVDRFAFVDRFAVDRFAVDRFLTGDGFFADRLAVDRLEDLDIYS